MTSVTKERAKLTTERQIAIQIGLAVLCLYLFSAAGRITSSDGHTMFLLTQSVTESGSFAVSEGNTETGPDGERYPKAGLGQAIASIPFYLVGKVAAPLLPARMRPFAHRAVTSLVTAFAGALLAVLAFLLFLDLGLHARGSLALTVALCFATPLWVYSKLYLSETLLALYLLFLLYGVVRLRRGGGVESGLATGFGFGFAVLTKYAIFPTAAILALPALPSLRHPRRVLWGLVVLLGCAAVAMFYNEVRTGSLFASGYGRQGTAAAFSTPMWVGLYGLLLSSGKGILWFAPLLALVPAGWVAWWRNDRIVAGAVGLAVVSTVLLYATFEHWAGDGSWGPRYLVPLIPLCFASIAVLLADPRRSHRRLWWAVVIALGLTGIAVQKGGVFISYGAQMREAGDYPYTLPLSDPRFMSDSHWNPRFAPILDHWRLFERNFREHLAGEWPKFHPSPSGGRIGLAEGEAASLTHGFDIWAFYGFYAGLPPWMIFPPWLLLLLLGFGYLLAAWRNSGLIQPRPPPRIQREAREAPVYQVQEDEARARKWSYLEDS